MINRPLFKKFIAESAILFAACALALLAFCWFRVWIVGELDTTRFRQIVDMLPKDWRKFSPVDFDWLVSYLGRTALTLDEPMLMMFISIWAIVRGTDVVSGGLSRGTLEMVLAQPVSRRQVYLQHMLFTILGGLVLCLVVWAGMSFGIWTTSVEESRYPEFRIPILDYRIPLTFLGTQTEVVPMVTQVDPRQFLPGILNLLCVSFFLACLSGFCSAWDRYRWRTLGLVIGFYFLNAMIKLLAMSSESFQWLWYLNFFGFYEPALAIQLEDRNPGAIWQLLTREPNGAVNGLGPLTNCLLLAGLGLVLLWTGVQKFNRRDLPAPV